MKPWVTIDYNQYVPCCHVAVLPLFRFINRYIHQRVKIGFTFKVRIPFDKCFFIFKTSRISGIFYYNAISTAFFFISIFQICILTNHCIIVENSSVSTYNGYVFHVFLG